MNGGGRRQLPSWMLRPCTIEETNVSEVKEENNENDPEKLATIASQTLEKAKRKKLESGVPLVENKSHRLKKCDGRTRDRKVGHLEEDQHENEPYLINQCRTRKSKRMYKQSKDQLYDLPQSNPETDDGSMRKKCRGNSLVNKKTNKSIEDSHDGTVPSEDELTVEDLVSIAKEYVFADMKESEKLQFKSEMTSNIAEVESEKDLTACKEDGKSHTYKPLSATSTSTDPLSREGSIICPIYTGDPARDMLDLLLGGLLKRSEEVERKNDAITKSIMLNHELCESSQNDTLAEVVPAMKKKASLKDKVAMLLD